MDRTASKKEIVSLISAEVDHPMEISASEIRLLCSRISNSIVGYSVSSIYSMNQGMLLRLRHETKEEKLIAISSFAAWLTTKNFSLPQSEPFVSRIRESIERTKLVNVSQEGTERIATFEFSSRSNESFKLHAEFFGGGNLILTKNGDILDVRNPQRFRHRSLVAGERYVLPPSRGKSLEDLNEDYLLKQLEKAKTDPQTKTIDAIRWFGRVVATTRKFVEEIFLRSGVNKAEPVIDLEESDAMWISRSSKNLLEEIEKSSKGYLLSPEESDSVVVDACPVVLRVWQQLLESRAAVTREFPSFNDALDEAQVQYFIHEGRARASKEIRSKAQELESAIKKQDLLLEKNDHNSKELRRLAKELMADSQTSQELLQALESMAIIAKDKTKGLQLRFANEPRSYLTSFETPRALASRLFDEAKRLEQNNRDITEIRASLVKRKDDLLEQGQSSEDRAAKRVSVERRARQWFERYRWFLSSDRRLAVGGRDSTSNSVIINKYMDENCLVFHADLHGSPFFLLMNARNQISSEQSTSALDIGIEQELAQATVSFSRAWKDELGSADAYWVEPGQIKKSAPSGEYLPRGSFFIEGKKNLVKHLRVELCVGLVTDDVLPSQSPRERNLFSDDERSLVVICGPERAIQGYCLSYVKIAPGKERSSSVARRVKQLLISKIKEEQAALKGAAKKIPIDDIIRTLPSGSFKIVSEKQNR